MSQRQLAAALAGDGASPKSVENIRRQISSWVNDEHIPSPENAAKLGDHLDAPAEWFTTETRPRPSLGAALEEISQVVGLLTDQVEKEQARSEDAARIVQGLDQRLARIEALLRQLLEGQLTWAAVTGATIEGLRTPDDDPQEDDPTRRRRTEGSS